MKKVGSPLIERKETREDKGGGILLFPFPLPKAEEVRRNWSRIQNTLLLFFESKT
jgi:hypothetical protein